MSKNWKSVVWYMVVKYALSVVCIHIAWNWGIVPVFELQNISVKECFGLFMCMQCVRTTISKPETVDDVINNNNRLEQDD